MEEVEMKLPPSKFYKAGEELFSLLFFNGRLYPLRNLKPTNSNFFYFLGKKFDIVQSERLDFLEKFYLKENKETIENSLQSTIDAKLKGLTKEVVHKDNTPLKKIVDEIMPRCNRIIFEKEQYINNKKIVVKKISKNEKSSFIDTLYNTLAERSLFYNGTLGKKDFVVINKQVYSLKKIPDNKVSSLKQYLSFFDQNYELVPKGSLLNFESKFHKEIDNYLSKSIDNYISRTTSFDDEIKDRRRLNDISNRLKKGNYEDKNVGLFRHNDGYYIYLNLPRYALKNNKSGDIYLFNSIKIGAKLRVKGNSLTLPVNELVSLQRYKHPYIWDDHLNEDGYQQFCYGNTDLFKLDKKDIVKKVTGALRKGYNIIYRPSMDGTGPVHDLTDMNFGSQKISAYDLRSLKLGVSNVS